MSAKPTYARIAFVASPNPEAEQARQRLVKRYGDAPLKSTGVPIENDPWSAASEAAALASFAVGIMPLIADPWTRGKCGAKILQYFAAGRPGEVVLGQFQPQLPAGGDG